MTDIEQLRQKRISLGIYLYEAAHALHVSRKTVQRWERGKQLPYGSELQRYARVLRILEKQGRTHKPVYNGGSRVDNPVPSIDIVSLKRTIYARGVELIDIAGMLGMVYHTLRDKFKLRRKMSISEHTAIRNALYELTKDVVGRLSVKEITAAKAMLKFYEVRVKNLHELLVQAVMLKSGTDYQSQKFSVVRPSGGSHSDPVVRRYGNIETVERLIESFTKDVRPVIEEYLELKNSEQEAEREMFLVFERYIIGKESIKDIAQSTGKSARTLYRRKYELTCRVAERIQFGAEYVGEKRG